MSSLAIGIGLRNNTSKRNQSTDKVPSPNCKKATDTMTHEEALNKILSNACSSPLDGEDEGWKEYAIELHCASFTVVAKPLGEGRYEIKRVERG